MGTLEGGQISIDQHQGADRSFQLRPLLSSPGRWRMQRISREASRVSNAFCLFASPILLRGKRSGIDRRRSDSAHVPSDGDKSLFNGNKGSYRRRRLGVLPVSNASSALAGDSNGLGFRHIAVSSRRRLAGIQFACPVRILRTSRHCLDPATAGLRLC